MAGNADRTPVDLRRECAGSDPTGDGSQPADRSADEVWVRAVVVAVAQLGAKAQIAVVAVGRHTEEAIGRGWVHRGGDTDPIRARVDGMVGHGAPYGVTQPPDHTSGSQVPVMVEL